MALGAQRGTVVWMVLRIVLILAAAGLALLGMVDTLPAAANYLIALYPGGG